jgi:hypothetical protein
MNRTEILQYLIDKYEYKSYLEIGVASGDTFTKIKCENKLGVDPSSVITENVEPVSSDCWFMQNEMNDNVKFDIIFIDGLHIKDQVIKDVNNSLKVLNEGGIIMLHDCNPPTEGHQIVPQMQGEWNGDVWKALYHFNRILGDYHVFTIDTDWGCGIIKYEENLYKKQKRNVPIFNDITYADLDNNRKEILNLITEQEFLKYI